MTEHIGYILLILIYGLDFQPYIPTRKVLADSLSVAQYISIYISSASGWLTKYCEITHTRSCPFRPCIYICVCEAGGYPEAKTEYGRGTIINTG